MTYGELHDILRARDSEPFTNFTLVDFDDNRIDGSDLFLLDFYRMRDWKVHCVCIDEHGYAEITLNSGNFKEFNFKNVY